MTDSVDEFRRAVEGATCGAVLAQAYGHHGQLVAPITVLYLQFGAGRWARFGIDGGHFHWRETTAPEIITPDGSGDSYPLIERDDAGNIRGHQIQRVSFQREPPAGGRLSIGLENGAALTLINENDQLYVAFISPAI